MDHEILAIALTFFVHVVAIAALIWHLLGQEDDRPDWRGWLGPDDGDDPQPSEPTPPPSRGGLPLPDAIPSLVRLREPGRLSDSRPRPARRPSHVPERVPAAVPAGDER